MADDRYRRLDLLGTGAAAQVYRARDTATDAVVALKVLAPALRPDRVALERFAAVAERVRQLRHPGITAVDALLRGDAETCLVMALAPGEDLSQYLARHHPVDPGAALALLRQVLEALAACHARQLLHGDLKPANVMVGPDGRVQLLDVGFALLSGRGDPLRAAAAPHDAPQYLAPEQRAGGLPDARSDLYALGVMAFELLTGGPLGAEATAADAPIDAATLAARRRGLPPWLPQWVERLLARQCEARYQTAGEALDDLLQRRSIAAGLPILARRRCPRCGEQTLRQRSSCLVCGWDAAVMLTPGDCDVWRGPGADARQIVAYGADLLGAAVPVGRRRLLLAGIDDTAAEVVRGGAAARALPLEVRARSPWAELRKAVPLAALGLIARGLYEHAASRWAYFGPYFFDQVDTLQVMQFVAPLALLWLCARDVRQKEVLPAWHRPRIEAPRSAAEVQLAPARGAWLGLGLQLAERAQLLEPSAARTTPPWDEMLRELVTAATRLIAPLAEIETRLRTPALQLRLCACHAALHGAEADAAAAAALHAYYDIEDRAARMLQRVVEAEALLARVAAQALVLHQPFDTATRAACVACLAGLTADGGAISALAHQAAGLT